MKQQVVGKGCVVEQGVVGKGGECGVVEQHVVGSGCGGTGCGWKGVCGGNRVR